MTTAICLVRIEPQPPGVLISLILNPDIAHVSTEQEFKFGGVEQALATVRGFVEAAALGSPSGTDGGLRGIDGRS